MRKGQTEAGQSQDTPILPKIIIMVTTADWTTGRVDATGQNHSIALMKHVKGMMTALQKLTIGGLLERFVIVDFCGRH
jgi:hypothetical protein